VTEFAVSKIINMQGLECRNEVKTANEKKIIETGIIFSREKRNILEWEVKE